MKKKGLVLLLVAVLLFVTAVLSLPLILSSSTVLRMVLDRVNARSAASIQIKTCSIGWQKGLECRDIRFRDPAAGLSVTIPRITGSQGLLALLVAPRNLGELIVHAPEIVLVEGKSASKGREEPEDAANKPAAGGGVTTAPAGPKAAGSDRDAPFWEDMQARLLIRDGKVTSLLHLQAPQVIARDLRLTSGLSDGSIAYTLGFVDGAGTGRLAATGFVNLPVRQSGFLDALVSMVDLQVTGFQVEGLLATVAGRIDTLPRGRGELSGNLSLKTAGLANMDVKGDLELRDLQLAGGFLGSDRPAFDKVNLHVDGTRKQGQDWILNALALNSDAGTLKAKGKSGPGGSRLEASGQLELPVLLARLPGLLRVRQGVAVKSGELGFSLALADQDSRVDVDVTTRLEQIGGEIDKRLFVWATPMTMALKAEAAGSRVEIRDLRFGSSFLTISGQGDMDNFTLQAKGDLEKGFRELGLLFDLNWSGTGTLDLQAGSRAMGENRYAMDLSATVDGFSLQRSDQTVLPPHRLTLGLHGTGSPAALTAQKGGMDIRCTIAAWPGVLRLVTDNLSRKDGDLTGRYRLATTLDLARLTDLLHNLELLPRQTTVTGGLDLQADGFLDQGVVAMRRLEAGIDRFLYHADGFSYRDEHLRLSTVLPAAPAGVPIRMRKLVVSGSPDEFLWTGNGHTAVNLAGRGLYLRSLRLDSGLGEVKIGELEIADWQRFLETLSGEVQASLKLDGLAGLLHANAMLDQQLSLAGRADLGLRVAQDKGQRWSLRLESPVTLVRGQTTILDRERVAINLDARRTRNSEDLIFDKIGIASRPLTLAASGLLGRGDQPALTLKGTVTPDLAVLAPILEAAGGTALTMSGRHASRFELHLPLERPAGKQVGQIRLLADLQAESILYRGIDLKDLTVPVRMEDGVLQAKIHAGLNGGTLAIDPVCRFTAKPPLLSVPDNERVLAGVQLQQPLAEGLLGRLHPLFGVLARPTGTLDMDLANFSWPLVEKGAEQARFQAVFDVSRVNLDSVGVLREVLTLAGLGGEKLELKDSTVTCSGARGRIECTPVKILVADSEMVISGSVGMDGTLDYLLQVPVTKNLVGREGYRVLAGTTIKVPIRGTLGKPLFNRDMVTGAISDLARQAAGREIRKQVEKALPGLLEGLIK